MQIIKKEVLVKDTTGQKTLSKKVNFGTVVLTNVVNPFDPINSKKVRTDLHGDKLKNYLEGFCLGQEYIVFVNKKETEDYDYIIQPNDNIVYIPLIKGGNGGAKNIIRLVAIAVISFYAPQAGAALAKAYGGVAAAWTAGLMLAGSLLVNAILPPSTPNISGITPPELESKSYSWNGIETNRNLNVPIPVLYGTHNIGGTVINNRFYYQDSKDWIATQLALCHGEIEDINPDDITINKADYSSFIPVDSEDEGYYKVSHGKFDQAIMTGFNESSFNNQAPSQKVIYDEPYSFFTSSNNIDKFRIHFECPNGLFTMDEAGVLSNKDIELKVEYRPKDGVWQEIIGQRREYKTQYELHGVYDTADTTETKLIWSDTKITNCTGIFTEFNKWCYTPTGKTRQTWTGNYVKSTSQGNGNILLISGQTRNSIKVYFEPNDATIDNTFLDKAQYEIKVTRLTPEDDDTDNFNQSNLYVRFIEEINTDPINYGGLALIGFKLKATQQISGSRPNYSIKTTRRNLIINGEEKSSYNPAWACYDLLTNPHYGGDILSQNIQYSEFEKWAEYCEEEVVPYETYEIDFDIKSTEILDGKLTFKMTESYINLLGQIAPRTYTLEGLNNSLSDFSLVVNGSTYTSEDISKMESIAKPDGDYMTLTFPESLADLSYTVSNSLFFSTDNYRRQPKLRFNGVIDTSTSLWQGVQDIATAGRGQIILQGNKYSVIYDAPKNITGLYNASNSKDVTITYVSQEDIATEVEVQFSDSNIKYEMNQISVQDSKAQLQGNKSKKTTIQVKGITTEEEALRHGRYLLATSKFIRRTATFKADIESLTQTLGDLVALQTDVTQYGSGGLIQDVQGNVVTLEQPIHLDSGKEYTLKIKQASNDVITDYHFIANTTEDTNLITLPDTSNIHILDRYTFGEKSSDSFLGIITDISRDGDLFRDVTIAEYNESILNFDFDDDMLQRTTAISSVKNRVTNFRGTDRLSKQTSGQVVPIISFTWDAVLDSHYSLYVKKLGTENDFYQRDLYELISDNLFGNSFEYSAESMGLDRRTYKLVDNNNLEAFDVVNFEVTAFDKIPDEVTNVFSNSDNGEVTIKWKANTELDFKKYIVTAKGKTYESTLPKVSIPENKVGSYEALIQVQDTSGNLSPQVSHTVTVTEPSLRYSIEDNQLLEKAFRDGVMTIFVGDGSDKTGAINYDIWKVQLSSLTVDEFTYASQQLDGLAFDDLNSSTFKYYQNGEWFLCTKSQLLVIQRMLGYATTNALSDGNVRVFNKQPFPPYSVGDIWLDGNLVRTCLAEKLE